MSQHDDVVTLSRGPELGLGVMISGCLWLIRSKHGQGLSFHLCSARCMAARVAARVLSECTRLTLADR